MLGGGRITAASMPHVGVSDDSTVDPSVVRFLQRAAYLEESTLGRKSQANSTPRQRGREYGPHREMTRHGSVQFRNILQGLWICAAYSGHGMRSATLSAKAVVRMILAERRGPTALGAEIDSMILHNDIPRSYLATAARMEHARQLPDVEAQERERAASRKG